MIKHKTIRQSLADFELRICHSCSDSFSDLEKSNLRVAFVNGVAAVAEFILCEDVSVPLSTVNYFADGALLLDEIIAERKALTEKV